MFGFGGFNFGFAGIPSLTSEITGSGDANYLPKFTGAQTIGNSVVYQDGSNIGIGITAATGRLHLPAGTTVAGTAPMKMTSGTSMTTAEAGAWEFTTDNLFFTITTGAARKRIVMADPVAGLTSGRVPYATTNGRLTDAATFTFDGTTTFALGSVVTINGSGIGISATPSATDVINITFSNNAASGYRQRNSNASAGTFSQFVLENAGAAGIMTAGVNGTGNTGGGAFSTASLAYSGSTTAAGYALVASNAAGVLFFYTGGSAAANERARILSTGEYVVNATQLYSVVAAQMEVNKAGAGGNTYGGIALNSWNSNTTRCAFLSFNKSASATIGTQTAVVSGETLGAINFAGSNGTTFLNYAQISAEVDGTPGAADAPGRLLFYTTTDGATTLTERMRINNAGAILIGQATATGRRVDILQDTGTLSIGSLVGSTSFPAIYFNASTPSAANYALAGGSTFTQLNTPTSGIIQFMVGGAGGEKGRFLSTGEFLVGRTAVLLTGDVACFEKNGNATTAVVVRNTNATSAAYAVFDATNNNTNHAYFGITSSAATGGGPFGVAETGVAGTSSPGGMAIYAGNATTGTINFYSGGVATANLRITLTAAGTLDFAAGTTANAQINLTPGVAPSSPADGDIYYIDTSDRLMFFKGAAACEIASISAVTSETVTADRTLTITFNGASYKLVALAI